MSDIYPSTVLADSPGGYWRMGEASGQPQDSSGNGNHTTAASGGKTYSQTGAIRGDSNSSILYTSAGGADYFTAPDHATLDVGDVFTLEAWMKLTTLLSGNYNCMLAKDDSSFFFATDTTDKLTLFKFNFGEVCTSTVAITDTGYHHFVATVNGATIKLYIDGADRTSTVTVRTFANNTFPLELGSVYTAYAPDGTLDELAVYPTALTAARVLAHYDAALALPIRFDYSQFPKAILRPPVPVRW